VRVMLSLILLAGVIAGTAPLAAAATTDHEPALWPVRFSEIYVIDPRSSTQLRLEPDAFRARRFHLRVHGPREFEVVVTRARDGAMLWAERRITRASKLVPWGRDEFGHVSISNPHDRVLEVTVEVATDPREDGLRVYSFFVNRFLEVYGAGDMERAEALLSRALAEDPSDTTATVLLDRLWKELGLTQAPVAVTTEAEERRAWKQIAERQRVNLVTAEVDSLILAGSGEQAIEVLKAESGYETDVGLRRIALLRGRALLAQGEFVPALEALYDALDAAPSVGARFEVYPFLIQANLAAGNRRQAQAVADRAAAEAPDDAALRRVRSWMPATLEKP
jgi:tetratricopeptide (TPR) repeat protein